MQRLGVFELDAFFPEKDRMALAGALNHLIARRDSRCGGKASRSI